MANPLYQQLMGQTVQQQTPMSGGIRFQNPLQKMQYVMQAMQNPVNFIKKNFPQIPEQAYCDPTGNGVLQYMMQNMGLTQQDIQNVTNGVPRW